MDFVPSVLSFASVMATVVLLYEYTNVFDSWLAWIFVPVMVSLIAYDVWLRAIRAMRGDSAIPTRAGPGGSASSEPVQSAGTISSQGTSA